MTSRVLVLRPGSDYTELRRCLTAAGWRELPPILRSAPLVPGEPESAEWVRGDQEAVAYAYNPAIQLRKLELVRGEDSVFESLAVLLPVMSASDLAAALESDDVRALLRGLSAAPSVGTPLTIPRVHALRDHPDERVRRAAARALENLSSDLVDQAARLALGKNRGPEFRPPALPRLDGGSQMRCQLLRRLTRQGSPGSGGVARALRSGLSDPSWELRVTAMLVAAVLGVRELAKPVRRVELPKDVASGLERDELRLLDLLRRLSHGLASGRISRTESIDAGRHGPLVEHLRRAVVGQPVETHDRAFLFVHSFITPVDYPDWSPEPLPPAIESDGDGYRLKQTGHGVVWVPSMQYWLGDDGDGAGSRPVHWVEPERGYFVLRDPADLGEPCTLDEATARCRSLGEREDLDARLLSPDEWEMALRGPDGRLYPWGNCLPSRSLAQGLTSAFGFLVPEPRCGEWALGDEGGSVVCGTGKLPRCAHRSQPSPGALHLVRPFIAYDEPH